ncbi:TPA: hypothetical protein NGT44_002462 [Vibrio parahaemolyticus]|nr:hypothetical protein [Vibrio parahaemolyticus]
MSPSSPKVAILITGLLRNISAASKWFNALPDNIDVFLVSNRGGAYEESNSIEVKSSYFIEDDFLQSKMQSDLLELDVDEGVKLLQWQKLWIGMQLIDKYCIEQSTKYDFVYKFRTDINFDFLDKGSLNLNKKINADQIFMCSDLIFGSTYLNMSSVSKFIWTAMTEYYDRSEAYKSIDYELMFRSDLSAAAFNRFKYPSDFFCKAKSIEDIRHMVESKVILHEEPTKKEAHYISPNKFEAELLFPSEPAFAHYINSLGLKACAITKVALVRM